MIINSNKNGFNVVLIPVMNSCSSASSFTSLLLFALSLICRLYLSSFLSFVGQFFYRFSRYYSNVRLPSISLLSRFFSIYFPLWRFFSPLSYYLFSKSSLDSISLTGFYCVSLKYVHTYIYKQFQIKNFNLLSLTVI